MEEHVHKKSWKHEIIEILKYVSLALIIVIPVRLFVAQPFIVSGESMYPTFHNSDYLIIDELTYQFRAPERGEVVVFRYPNDPSRFFIKRVIGLPGETIVLKGATLTIKNAEHPDGFVLKEPYVSARPLLGNKTIVLPDDQYFVMGDNRPASSDSRIWGPLPEDLIVGRALLRLLPVGDIAAVPGSIKSFDLDTYEVTE